MNDADADVATVAATAEPGREGARMRKRVTRVLAWIGGGLVAFILSSGAVMRYVGPRLDAEAKAYVEQTLPRIIGSWNVEELRHEASPELLRGAGEKLATFYQVSAERLGPLKTVQAVKGDSYVRFWVFPWSLTIGGNFVADVLFEKAAARVSIKTIRRNGRWQYQWFYVNSDAYLQPVGE